MKSGARRTSGLEQIPPVFSRPLVKDRFFWLLIGMIVAWAAVLWYFFF